MPRRFLLLFLAAAGVVAAQDPPARVGRLNYVTGSVSFEPAGVNQWAPAAINRPLTVGDQLYTDSGARAEIHVPGTALRLGSQTAFEFLNLDDSSTQMRLSEGTLDVRVDRLSQNLEVDTPNLAFVVTRPGEYRIDTNPDTFETYVTVRSGEGQVTANSGTFAVRAGGQAVVTGQNGAQYNIYQAPAYDGFDNWVLSRDRREDRLRAEARYVSPDVVGYEDLEQYGYWRRVPEYGECWVPRDVPVGWAPYHEGQWAWIDPWGWTWVDDEPWGFAPFHYGRWAYIDGFWAWVPGPVAVVPVYAPALVAWVGFGGGGFGGFFGFGAGPAVGWFPLGPRDVYIPAYQASPVYISRVNITNTTVIDNATVSNVYNNYVRTHTISTVNYMNRSVPGAVMAVPQNALASGQSVRKAAIRVTPSQLQAARVVDPAPHVAPQVASVLGRAPSAFARTPRPPAAVISRPVVARSTPPPARAPFHERQALLARNPGHPLPIQQQRQMARTTPAAARPPVRVVAMARPVRPPVSRAPAPRSVPERQTRAMQPQARPQPPQTSSRSFEPPSAQRQNRPAQAQLRPNTPAYRPSRQAVARQAQPRPASRPRSYEPPAAQARRAPTPPHYRASAVPTRERPQHAQLQAPVESRNRSAAPPRPRYQPPPRVETRQQPPRVAMRQPPPRVAMRPQPPRVATRQAPPPEARRAAPPPRPEPQRTESKKKER